LSGIDEVIRLIHLDERSKVPTRTPSGQMQQRLMIALALLRDPPVPFLDEPTRRLDPIAAREVREIIKSLCQNGKTILLTTHLLEKAEQLCDRVAFMVNRRLVANDTPQNLRLSHGKRPLKLTLTDSRQPDHLTQLNLNIDEPKDQHRLEHQMAGGNLRAVHSQEATLEDVFSELAGMRPG
jgi:ABC-2 type transport system ATP-binding protein